MTTPAEKTKTEIVGDVYTKVAIAVVALRFFIVVATCVLFWFTRSPWVFLLLLAAPSASWNKDGTEGEAKGCEE